MEVYSAHDKTIAMFLGALQVFPPQLPSYAAAVMVELYRAHDKPGLEDEDEHFVKVYFS
jgi:hypothetical protein